MGSRKSLLGREDVALLQAILKKKIAELDRAASVPDFDAILAQAERMTSASRTWDWARMERELAVLQEVLARRRDRRDEAMREVRSLTRQKAALVATVTKIERYHAEFMTLEEIATMTRFLWGLVTKHVHDPEMLAEIRAGFHDAFAEIREDRMEGGRKGTKSSGRPRHVPPRS